MAQRIDAEQVRRKLEDGEDVLLVCGYDDDQRCADAGVEGSLTYTQFRAQLGRIPKDQEIVFYCA